MIYDLGNSQKKKVIENNVGEAKKNVHLFNTRFKF